MVTVAVISFGMAYYLYYLQTLLRPRILRRLVLGLGCSHFLIGLVATGYVIKAAV